MVVILSYQKRNGMKALIKVNREKIDLPAINIKMAELAC
jgi:hypothetical protein